MVGVDLIARAMCGKSVTVNDERIDDANNWLTNGYIKTRNISEEYATATANLPSVCTGQDRWGVLFYVAENNTNHAGLQQYFPIDGTYKGRLFYRSVTGLNAETPPIFGDWKLVPWSTEVPPALPADAGSKTYTLKAVNGTLTWVQD